MTTQMRPFRSVLYILDPRIAHWTRPAVCPWMRLFLTLRMRFPLMPRLKPRDAEGGTEQGGYGNRYKIIRINGLDTEWGAEDIAALRDAPADAILVPKVNSAADMMRYRRCWGTTHPSGR